MKRFMKGCGIAALIMATLGFVLAMAGSSIAGKSMIEDVVESATGGRVHVNPRNWLLWGIHVGDGRINAEFGDMAQVELVDEVERVDRGLAESMEQPVGGYTTVRDTDPMFSSKYDIITGSREKYCPGDGIQNLKVEIAGCQLITVESYDGHIYLEVYDMHRFQAYVKGDTLHVKAKSRSVNEWADGGTIFLYLPSGYSFTDVDVELGAGDFTFTGLKAAEASLEVGAGQINIQDVEVKDMNVSVGAGYICFSNMQVTDLDVEIGMGAFSADGIVNGDVDVECSMGSVDMVLQGREQDFNYSLEGAMGTIDLGINTYGGLAEEREINNHAAKEMDIECSMGNVSIMFTD